MSNLVLKTAITTTLFGGCVAHAEELQQVTLDEVVVTASRNYENINHIPASVAIIEPSTIEQEPLLNLSDMIQKDASIYVKQNGGIGQGTGPSLRGSKSNHILMLKDGIRLNTPNTLTPFYPETLDLTNIERVEILKGPASVQYGSDAIAGVIQVLSKTPQKTGVQATAIYGENKTHKVSVGGDVVADNGLYASVSAQRMKTDGSRIFDTQAKDQKAGFDQKGFGAKVGYANEELDISVAIDDNEGTNEYSSDYRTINAQRHFKNRSTITKLSTKLNDELTLSAHYGQAKDEQQFVEEYGINNFNTDYKDGDVNLRWQLTPNQNVLFGVNRNETKYQDAYAYQGTKAIQSTGYYLQHQYHSQGLDTQAGMRVEDNKNFGTHTVGQLAARYHFSPQTSVYANVGSAFRAPSLNELYYLSEFAYTPSPGSTYTYYTLGNPNLKPEKSLSYEVGINHKINDLFSVSVSAYDTKIKNLIATETIYGQNQSTSTYQNLDKATLQGAELSLNWQKDYWFASAQYAYTKTKDEQRNKEIAYRPKNTAVLTAGYDDGFYGVSTSIIARSDAAVDYISQTRLPGHTTVDINAFWRMNPFVKVFANIQNVLNQEYKVVYNSYPTQWYLGNDRQASIGVTFKY